MEWMTSKSDWDPSKFDYVAGASKLSISQFPPIPLDTIDPFYTTQGDIRAIKSDVKNKLEIEPTDIDLIFSPGHMADVDRSLKDPVVNDTAKDVVVDDIVKDPVAVGSDSTKEPTKDLVVDDTKTDVLVDEEM